MWSACSRAVQSASWAAPVIFITEADPSLGPPADEGCFFQREEGWGGRPLSQLAAAGSEEADATVEEEDIDG